MLWFILIIALLQLNHLSASPRSVSNTVWESLVTPFLNKDLKTAEFFEVDPSLAQNSEDSDNENVLGNPSNFANALDSTIFFGNWWNLNGKPPVETFMNDNGFMYIDNTDSEGDDTNYMDFEIFIFDGAYMDQNYAKLGIYIPVADLTFNATNATYTISNYTMPVAPEGNKDKNITCASDISIYLLDYTKHVPYTSQDIVKSKLGVQFMITSPQCSISLITNVLTTQEFSMQDLIIYVGAMTFAALVGIMATHKIIQDFPANIERLKKLSLWSIWFINGWDFFLFLLHVAYAVGLDGWLMVIAISFFVLSIMSQTRLVYAVYFSSYFRSGNSMSSGCKFFAIYYSLLYLLNFSYTYYTEFTWTLITSSFYLVPQIVHVFQRGRNYRFNYWHVFGFGVSRLVFVLYIKAYPKNIYRNSQDWVFISTYFGIILLQLLILFIQRWWPKFFLTPRPYKYFVRLTTEEEKAEICAICMEPFGESPPDVTKPLLKSNKTVRVMETPCKHRYHEHCLKEWMKNKLVCPFDRTDIPPFNNNDIS